jgi:hypothetical protein
VPVEKLSIEVQVVVARKQLLRDVVCYMADNTREGIRKFQLFTPTLSLGLWHTPPFFLKSVLATTTTQ